MNETEKKREREKQTVSEMIALYCRKNHGTGRKQKRETETKKEGMMVTTKAGILSSVTILMGLGFFFMARKGIWVPCIILAVVWFLHMIYFIFFVKTISSEETINGWKK